MNKSCIEYAFVFKVISDESRLRIINMLSCGSMCACEILEKLDISQSTLSYHMKILTDSGLVGAVRDGSWMRYAVNKNRVKEVLLFFDNLTSDKESCACKKS